jgi:hypothetical protein
MEDKRGTKRLCSPSKEGRPSPNGAQTSPLAPTGSPPPPGSPSEISSCCPCSLVFEQGGPSEKAAVIDLSHHFSLVVQSFTASYLLLSTLLPLLSLHG